MSQISDEQAFPAPTERSSPSAATETDGPGQVARIMAAATLDQYARRWDQCVGLATKHVGHPPNPEEIVDWLIHAKPTISPPTYRLWKSAILHRWRNADDDDTKGAAIRLRSEPQTGCRATPSESGRLRRKNLPTEDLERLILHLHQLRSEFAHPLILWLKATRLVGLRPCEWPRAQILTAQDGKAQLLVGNAKFSNGRALGPTRTLLLGSLPDASIGAIHGCLKVVRLFVASNEFPRLYDNCRKLLARANQQLWPERRTAYTLYSARHAFSANAKARFDDRRQVAALMGHASDATAGRHYGKRRSADSVLPPMPVPAPANVAAVRQVAAPPTFITAPAITPTGQQAQAAVDEEDTEQ